jgi:sulfite reductase (ferredoxin)
VGYFAPERLPDVARAAVTIHRDFGDRADRRHARLKYILADRGLAWFKSELEARAGFALEDPRPLAWTRDTDWFGWHRQDGGLHFFGLSIVAGRLDGALRRAVREIVERLRPEVRLTPRQNLLFCGLRAEDRPVLESILAAHGVALPSALPPILRQSMACVSLPTCGLALAESERVAPEVITAIQAEFDAAGLAGLEVQFRISGCPNGCARPYTAEIGIVGESPDLYSIHLGGSLLHPRIADAYLTGVRRADIARRLGPVIREYAAESAGGESFGDYCHRAGLDNLRARHGNFPQ